jgi:hypothetical protein
MSDTKHTAKSTTVVATEKPVVEQPKAAETKAESKTIATAPDNRQYIKNAKTPISAKGKQRQIVLDILNAATKPMTAVEIVPIADAKGLFAVGGTLPSVKYHLNLLKRMGEVEIVNATSTVAATAEKVA